MGIKMFTIPICEIIAMFDFMEIAIRDIGTKKGFIKEEPCNVVCFEKYQKDNILQ
jgi:hypothetical protein